MHLKGVLFPLVCIYQQTKEVEWTPCSPNDQVKTKTLALVKSKHDKCPEKKILSKTCKEQNNAGKSQKSK